jgi:hypothetical protein
MSSFRKSLAQPEPLRLRYRRQLHELVADIVREKQSDFLPILERYAEENIDMGDRAAFCEMVQDEVKRLHLGIIARYRLRPSKFAAGRTRGS